MKKLKYPTEIKACTARNLKKRYYRARNRRQNLASLLFILLVCTLYSCQDEFYKETQEVTPETDSAQFIDYNGLPVRHRFSTPVKELTIVHNEKTLKNLYQKVQQSVAKNKGISFKAGNEEFPDIPLLVAGTDNVIDQFPYSKIQTHLEDEVAVETDTIPYEVKQILIERGLLTEEDNNTIPSEEENTPEINWEMIQKDFPTLTEAEIQEHIELIDAYYTQNFNYVLLEEIAKNKMTIANKIAQKSKLSAKSEGIGLGAVCAAAVAIARGTLVNIAALALAGDQADTSADNYYNGLGDYNTRKDAYRHILWNALLAQYYVTLISSKQIRIGFAKDVTDAYESCGNNAIDSREMDFHNNAIGRKIYDDNTSYIKFLGMTIGIDETSVSNLKSIAQYYVNKKSCYLVKETREDNRFPESLLTFNNSDEDIKTKITNTAADVPVYFIGPIRISYDYLPVDQYDYSNCTEEDRPWSERLLYTLYWSGVPMPIWYTWYSPCVIRTIPSCYQI